MTATTLSAGGKPLARLMLNKVPQITLFFWVIKILATTVGETAADFLGVNLHMGLTKVTLLMGFFLVIALVAQFRLKAYSPPVYWVAVVLMSVFGTLVTDNMVDNFHISLWTSTAIFTVLMFATFGAWYASEKTLSIHSITTTKREAFYWLAILFTFALGTAAGDLVAEKLNLGYWRSAVVFMLIILCTFAAQQRLGLNAVLAFWMAYVITRPLGASVGDYLSQDKEIGGLELGTTKTSFIFLAVILAVVTYISVTKKDATPTTTSSGVQS
jgi:uncharacterized membrane-anchored protein